MADKWLMATVAAMGTPEERLARCPNGNVRALLSTQERNVRSD